MTNELKNNGTMVDKIAMGAMIVASAGASILVGSIVNPYLGAFTGIKKGVAAVGAIGLCGTAGVKSAEAVGSCVQTIGNWVVKTFATQKEEKTEAKAEG